MRLGLGHAVQIEPCLDVALAAPEPLGGRAVDAGEAVERRCYEWRRLRGFGLRARLDRARLGRNAGGTPALRWQGTTGERRDAAHRPLPQRRVFTPGAAHPRP